MKCVRKCVWSGYSFCHNLCFKFNVSSSGIHYSSVKLRTLKVLKHEDILCRFYIKIINNNKTGFRDNIWIISGFIMEQQIMFFFSFCNWIFKHFKLNFSSVFYCIKCLQSQIRTVTFKYSEISVSKLSI